MSSSSHLIVDIPRRWASGAEDFQGFVGDVRCFSSEQVLEGAHVVQAVGQLDQDDADVLGHGHEHLAVVFGLLFLFGFEADAPQLGDPVYQMGDIGAKFLFYLFQGHPRILHHIVQQGGHDGGGIHLQVCQDSGHLERMEDIGFPGFAHLSSWAFSAIS